MPVTGATRELSVTYNGVTVGGSTAKQEIHGFTRQDMGKDRASVSFDLVLKDYTTAALFAAACDAIEVAFRTPYKDLTVALGGSNLIAVTQSGSTGLDAIASIDKPGGPPDSGRSRRYRIRIEWGLPATWAATPGLRDSHVILAKGPQGRALVTLRGTFTAITSSDAKAVYDGAIAAWAAAQKSWLGISTWQLVEEPTVDVSVNRKTCEFSRVYQETFATQGATGVVRQELTVTRLRRGSEFSPVSSAATSGGTTSDTPGGSSVDVVPLTDVLATYSAWIDKTVSTDLKGTWATLESFVVAQIAAELGTSSFAMLTAAPTYHIDENKITAQLTGQVQDVDTSGIVQNVFEQSTRKQPGYEFIPVWNGDPTAAIVAQGQAIITRTTTRRYRTLGASSSGSGGSSGGASNPWIGGGGNVGWGAIPSVGSGLGNILIDSADAIAGELPFNMGPDADGGSGSGSGSGGDGSPVGGGGPWYLIDQDQGSRPLAIGRKPFLIYLTERFYTTIERFATAVE